MYIYCIEFCFVGSNSNIDLLYEEVSLVLKDKEEEKGCNDTLGTDIKLSYLKHK